MERWWPFGRPHQEPVQLPPDPADWTLGDGEKGKQTLSLLLHELRSPAPSRRERAVELLAEAATDESITALLSLLQHEEHVMVRWKALLALEQLTAGSTEVIEHPVEDVETLRDDVVDELLQRLGGEKASQRWAAAEALGRMGHPRAVPALVESLRDEHAFVRWAAAQALGEIREETAIPLLLPMLKDPDPLVRRGTVDALGHFHTEVVQEALHQALRDPDSMVRRNAIEAVARLGDVTAVESLIAAVDSRNDLWVRYSAAEALGTVGDHRAIPPLLEAVGDSHVLIRRAAVRALGLLRDSRAIPSLVHALQDEDAQVRLHAVDGLGRIGHDGVLPHLRQLVHDSAKIFDRDIGEAAQKAIKTIEGRLTPG